MKRYGTKYSGARPGIFSGQGYDNILVIIDAIKRAGKPSGDLLKDREAVKAALAKTNIKLTRARSSSTRRARCTP